MRALCGTVAFLAVVLGHSAPASARLPLIMPRVSLSLALDWNKVVLARALTQPSRAAEAIARRAAPTLPVTAAPPRRAGSLDVAAYGRIERVARSLVSPRYEAPAGPERRRVRAVYVTPYAPYLGCYGLNVNIESDVVVR